MTDTSSETSGGDTNAWFEQFPSAAAAVGHRVDGDYLDQPAYRFWFLLRSGEPVVCLESTGTIHRADGTHAELGSVDVGVSAVRDILSTLR
jgi:hypothetical protein